MDKKGLTKSVGAALLALAASASLAQAGPTTFGYTGSLQTFSVTTTGVYDIDLFGAQGGGQRRQHRWAGG